MARPRVLAERLGGGAARPFTSSDYWLRIPRQMNAGANAARRPRCRRGAAPPRPWGFARSGIVVPGKSNCASRIMRVGPHVAERVPDVPERPRPDPAVVHAPRRSDPPGSAGPCRRAAGSAAPSRWYDTESQSATQAGRGAAVRARTTLGDGDRPVVAEALADRARLGRARSEALREVDRVAVLVEDDLPRPRRRRRRLSRSGARPCTSVANELSRPHWFMRSRCGSLLTGRSERAEAEALDVLLRLGNPVVGHRLLEAVVVGRP